MHELGIADDLVKALITQIKKKNISAVKKIYLQLGREALLTEESLRFCFQHSSAGTVIQDATLEVALVEGKEIRIDSLEVG